MVTRERPNNQAMPSGSGENPQLNDPPHILQRIAVRREPLQMIAQSEQPRLFYRTFLLTRSESGQARFCEAFLGVHLMRTGHHQAPNNVF